MNADKLKSVSKRMSYILRHRPDSVGLELGPGGWVGVDLLLVGLNQTGKAVTREVLEQVVAENDKQRFEFSDDGTQIRARQGHSTPVDLQYDPAVPPDVLYHGTATRFLESIRLQGLIKGKRHHVHLSAERATALAVGSRHGKPVILEIDTSKMQADGHRFFVTENRVWLTEQVPPHFLNELGESNL